MEVVISGLLLITFIIGLCCVIYSETRDLKYPVAYCNLPESISEVSRGSNARPSVFSFNGEIISVKKYEKWFIKGDWLPNIKDGAMALVQDPPKDYRELLGTYVILEINNYDDWMELEVDNDKHYCSGFVVRKLETITEPGMGVFTSNTDFCSVIPLTKIKKALKYYTV